MLLLLSVIFLFSLSYCLSVYLTLVYTEQRSATVVPSSKMSCAQPKRTSARSCMEFSFSSSSQTFHSVAHKSLSLSLFVNPWHLSFAHIFAIARAHMAYYSGRSPEIIVFCFFRAAQQHNSPQFLSTSLQVDVAPSSHCWPHSRKSIPLSFLLLTFLVIFYVRFTSQCGLYCHRYMVAESCCRGAWTRGGQ